MKTILIISLFIYTNTYSQIDSLSIKRSELLQSIKIDIKQTKLKEYLPSAIFVFLSGASDGVRDYSLFHNHTDNQFWDGSKSWQNKYKNGDIKQGEAYFGSTNILAFTTDAPHLFNMLNHQATGMAFALMPTDNNKKISHVFLKVLSYNLVRQMGQSLMYSVLLK